MSFRCGIEARHGPHHVAQNCTIYALPGWNVFTGSPCTYLPLSSFGAGSPTLRLGPVAAKADDAIAIKTICAAHFVCFVFIKGFICVRAIYNTVPPALHRPFGLIFLAFQKAHSFTHFRTIGLDGPVRPVLLSAPSWLKAFSVPKVNGP